MAGLLPLCSSQDFRKAHQIWQQHILTERGFDEGWMEDTSDAWKWYVIPSLDSGLQVFPSDQTRLLPVVYLTFKKEESKQQQHSVLEQGSCQLALSVSFLCSNTLLKGKMFETAGTQGLFLKLNRFNSTPRFSQPALQDSFIIQRNTSWATLHFAAATAVPRQALKPKMSRRNCS